MNQLTVQNNLKLWEDQQTLQEIKDTFCKKLTNTEFSMFVQIGKHLGLNPFLREIWAIKYKDDAPAAIFVGRDGYRRRAQDNPDYDYHQVDAVYSNDTFEFKNGYINHSYKIQNRGQLVGAYCVVQRKSASKPHYVFVNLSEYKPEKTSGSNTWHTKPATMIKKVAEAQALRMAFQSLFEGTYDESEYWRQAVQEQEQEHDVDHTHQELMNVIEGEAEPVEQSQSDQEVSLDALKFLWEFSLSEEERQAALEKANINSLDELSHEQIQKWYRRLQLRNGDQE